MLRLSPADRHEDFKFTDVAGLTGRHWDSPTSPTSPGSRAGAAGARAEAGVCAAGRWAFAVRAEGIGQRRRPGSLRIGWSCSDASLDLGADAAGWAYDSSGRKMHDGKSRLFGQPMAEGDWVTALLDLEGHAVLFQRNGSLKDAGFAFPIPAESWEEVFYPHVCASGAGVRVCFSGDFEGVPEPPMGYRWVGQAELVRLPRRRPSWDAGSPAQADSLGGQAPLEVTPSSSSRSKPKLTRTLTSDKTGLGLTAHALKSHTHSEDKADKPLGRKLSSKLSRTNSINSVGSNKSRKMKVVTRSASKGSFTSSRGIEQANDVVSRAADTIAAPSHVVDKPVKHERNLRRATSGLSALEKTHDDVDDFGEEAAGDGMEGAPWRVRPPWLPPADAEELSESLPAYNLGRRVSCVVEEEGDAESRRGSVEGATVGSLPPPSPMQAPSEAGEQQPLDPAELPAAEGDVQCQPSPRPEQSPRPQPSPRPPAPPREDGQPVSDDGSRPSPRPQPSPRLQAPSTRPLASPREDGQPVSDVQPQTSPRPQPSPRLQPSPWEDGLPAEAQRPPSRASSRPVSRASSAHSMQPAPNEDEALPFAPARSPAVTPCASPRPDEASDASPPMAPGESPRMDVALEADAAREGADVGENAVAGSFFLPDDAGGDESPSSLSLDPGACGQDLQAPGGVEAAAGPGACQDVADEEDGEAPAAGAAAEAQEASEELLQAASPPEAALTSQPLHLATLPPEALRQAGEEEDYGAGSDQDGPPTAHDLFEEAHQAARQAAAGGATPIGRVLDVASRISRTSSKASSKAPSMAPMSRTASKESMLEAAGEMAFAKVNSSAAME